MDELIRFGGVYTYTNRINDKVYVGIVRDYKGNGRSFNDRRKEHERVYKHGDSYLYRSMRKYGIENFVFEIIESHGNYSITPREIDNLEKYYISKLNTFAPNGYNLTKGGQGCIGMIHDNETREKISLANKKRFECENERVKSRNAANARWSREEERIKNGHVMRETYKRYASENPNYRTEISRAKGAKPFILIDVRTGVIFYKDPENKTPWLNRHECNEKMQLGEYGSQSINGMLNDSGHRRKIKSYVAVYINEDPIEVEKVINRGLELLENEERLSNIKIYEVNMGEKCEGLLVGEIFKTTDITTILPNASVDSVRGLLSKQRKYMCVDGKFYTCVPGSATDSDTKDFIERACNPYNRRPFRMYDRRTLKPINDKIYFDTSNAVRDIFPEERSTIGSQILSTLKGEVSYVHNTVPIYDDLTQHEIKEKLERVQQRGFIAFKYNPSTNDWINEGVFVNQNECQRVTNIHQSDISHVLLGKSKYMGYYCFIWEDDNNINEKLNTIIQDQSFCGWDRKFHLAVSYLRKNNEKPKYGLVCKDVHGVKHTVGNWLCKQRYACNKKTITKDRLNLLIKEGLINL